MTQRIAMWSGPRNISSALMRAWGNRSDAIVCDEPFYACYLRETGYTHHPEYDRILAEQETDWQQVVAALLAPLPPGKQVFYQKLMGQHLLPQMSLDWTEQVTNAFLIRDPQEMLLSLFEFFPNPEIEETGLPQQAELFRREQQRTGATPVVIDAKDVLLDPRGMLEQLCQRLAVPFDPCMLHWEPGFRATDGVWARHWYKNVVKTTTFGPYHPKTGVFPPERQSLLDRCQALYDELAAHKIQTAMPQQVQ